MTWQVGTSLLSGTRLLVGLVIGLVSSVSYGQIAAVDDTTMTPLPGRGHDYIHMLSETVNPANGSVSLRIQIPVRPGRGIGIPFSIGYDSAGVNHLVPGYYPNYGTANWAPNTGTLSQGGWSYIYPAAGAIMSQPTEGNYPTFYTCNVVSSYIFRDANGGVHQLNLGNSWTNAGGGDTCTEGFRTSGGDSQFTASLTNQSNSPPLMVYSGDGTVYNFGPVSTSNGTSQAWGWPQSIEDRNGNEIVPAGTTGFTDTLGLPVISWSSNFGTTGSTVTVGGLSYQFTWKTTSASFSVNPQWADSTDGQNTPFDNCSPPAAVNDTPTVISQITLPNLKSYSFYYGNDAAPHGAPANPYGLLSEIDYPSGGWVTYTWGLPGSTSDPTKFNEIAFYPGVIFNAGVTCPQSSCPVAVPGGCAYQYQAPVVLARSVGFGGSSSSLTQTFAYTTNWNPPNQGETLGLTWATKVTTLNSTDSQVGKTQQTSYTYGPIYIPADPFGHGGSSQQVPVEKSIAYYDWGSSGGGLLRTVNKTWSDQFLLTSEQTVLQNGLTSTVNYTYGPYGRLAKKDEYDFGQTNAPSRSTQMVYEAFSGTPGVIDDRPCKTVVYDAAGKAASETDYLYDGGGVVCGRPGTLSVASAGGSSLTGHDATTFSAGSTVSRGNVTTKIQRLASGSSSPSTAYTYDETGQVTSITDANGNTTQYSYADQFLSTNTGSYTTTAGNPPAGMVTNTYVTTVTRPPTATSHITSYTYGYNDGELTTATDENQKTMIYRYNDPLGRLNETDNPVSDGGQTTVFYNDSPPSPTITTTTKLSSTTNKIDVTVLDGMGHTVQTQITSVTPGITAETAYTGTGLVLSHSNPHVTGSSSTDGTTAYVYDGLGRTKTVTQPDGSTIQTTYATSCSPVTNVFGVTVTDEAGKVRTSCSDGLGRMRGVFEDPSGFNYETDYQYDILNNLLSVTQKGGSSQTNWRTRTFVYDGVSRLLSATNPESGTVSYSYDPNGNVISKTDARNIQTTMKYDALNRVIQKSYSDGTPAATFYYDAAPAPWGPGIKNTNGRLVEATTGITPEP